MAVAATKVAVTYGITQAFGVALRMPMQVVDRASEGQAIAIAAAPAPTQHSQLQ